MLPILLATIVALIQQVSSLAVILQTMDPYCFMVPSVRMNEIRLQYVISGLNEDQVEFSVSIIAIGISYLILYHFIDDPSQSTGALPYYDDYQNYLIVIQAKFANSDEPLHGARGEREHETVIRPHRDGPVLFCWTKTDRKSKKLTFNF